MLIGLRNGMLSGGWKNPYVTDGLVAMWDGEWNAGGGVHDPNATTWKDLTRNGWDFPATNLIFHDDRVEALADVSCVKSSAEFWDWTGATFDGTFERPTTTTTKNGFFTLGRIGIGNINNFYVNGCIWYTSASASNWRCLYQFVASDGSSRARGFEKAHRAFASDFSHEYTNQRYYQNGIRYTGQNEVWTTNIAHNALEPTLYVGTVGTPKFYGIRLYSRALTATEIAANYAVDKARFNLP